MRTWAWAIGIALTCSGFGCEDTSDNEGAQSDGLSADATGDAQAELEECPQTCTEIPKEGLCADNIIVHCTDGEPVCEECNFGRKCIFDEVENSPVCRPFSFENPDCVPACSEKACGDDGCGGSCGFCPEGSVCDQVTCWRPGTACASIEMSGSTVCLNDILAECVDNTLNFLDCTDFEYVCAFNAALGKHDCLVP